MQTRLNRVHRPNENQLDLTPNPICITIPHPTHPRVSSSRDIDSSYTGQNDLELRVNPLRPWRISRTIAYERLTPITDLSGDAFVIAWVQCIRLHYIAWNNGYHHGDLNSSKLMIQLKEDQPYGVIMDWDTTCTTRKPQPRQDVTGTIPFMALDLEERILETPAPVRCYSDDLESLLWALFWEIIGIKGRGKVQRRCLAAWKMGDVLAHRQTRFVWLGWPDFDGVSSRWNDQLSPVRRLVDWLSKNTPRPNVDDDAEGNMERLRCVLKIVEEHLGCDMPNVPLIAGL